MDSRTWADLKAGTVFRAMFWPSPTCMHVFLWDDNIAPVNTRKTRISSEQYCRLVEYIQGSFRRDEGGRFMCVKGRGYGPNDAFYEAARLLPRPQHLQLLGRPGAEDRRGSDRLVHPAPEDGVPLHARRSVSAVVPHFGLIYGPGDRDRDG